MSSPSPTGRDVLATSAAAGAVSLLPARFASGAAGNTHQGCSGEAARLLDDVRRAMERNPEGARVAALRLVTLLTPPAASEWACTRGGLAPWQKRKVDRYLKQRLEDRLRVEDLAQQVSLSVSHFCRAFKVSFGTTPHTHITRLRVELAQRLMLTTEYPLIQIALACGMADQAHLSKLFRRGVGETPTAWRRRNLTEAQVEARSRPPTDGAPQRAATVSCPSSSPRAQRSLPPARLPPGRPNDHGWRRAAQIEQDRERAWRDYGHRERVRRHAVHGDDPA